jgi:hypothetical protein
LYFINAADKIGDRINNLSPKGDRSNNLSSKADRLYLSLFRNTNIMVVKTPKQAVEKIKFARTGGSNAKRSATFAGLLLKTKGLF